MLTKKDKQNKVLFVFTWLLVQQHQFISSQHPQGTHDAVPPRTLRVSEHDKDKPSATAHQVLFTLRKEEDDLLMRHHLKNVRSSAFDAEPCLLFGMPLELSVEAWIEVTL